ncbi:MAG: anti-sigma factor domain-containing protein [Actinomycetota bacterium]
MGTGVMDGMRHEDLKGLLAPYVLGALPPDEAATIRSHLMSCDECRDEVDDMAIAESSLALAVEPEPLPPGFADRVIARLERETPAAVPLRRERRAWSPLLVLSYAALVIVIAVLGASFLELRQEEARERRIVQALLRDEGMSLQGAGAVARMVPTDDGGLFVAAGLDEAPEGETYQLWLIEGSCGSDQCPPISAGTFEPSDALAVVETERSLQDVEAVAVTIERDGGSEQPTGDPILSSG